MVLQKRNHGKKIRRKKKNAGDKLKGPTGLVCSLMLPATHQYLTLYTLETLEPPKKKKKQKHTLDEDTPRISSSTLHDQETTPSTSSSESQSKKEKKKDKKDKERKKELLVSAVDTATIPDSDTTSAPTDARETSAQDASAYLKKHSISLDFPGSSSGAVFHPFTSFSQLQVPQELRSAFDGFKEPTPIQACTWPLGLDGRDVVGIAETGRFEFQTFLLSHLHSSLT
jgi:ATP-dependent RNA helicase DBP3